MQTRSISILNFKGGVGKTTVTLSIGDELRRRGHKVIMVDCDRQRNASSIVPSEVNITATLKEVLMEEATVSQAMYEVRPGLFIIPSHTDLEKAARYLVVNGSTKTLKRLKYGLAQEQADFILFDHSPSYNSVTDAALLASSEMLIPVLLEPFSIEGLLDMITKLSDVLDQLEHEVQTTGIIPNDQDNTMSMTGVYLQSLRDNFAELMLPPVRTDAQVKKAQSLHQFIHEYNPQSKLARDFATVVDEILKR
jgi:chromosome partitioning protein